MQKAEFVEEKKKDWECIVNPIPAHLKPTPGWTALSAQTQLTNLNSKYRLMKLDRRLLAKKKTPEGQALRGEAAEVWRLCTLSGSECSQSSQSQVTSTQISELAGGSRAQALLSNSGRAACPCTNELY